MRAVLWIQLGCWLALGWAFRAWRVAILGLIVTIPAMFALTLWGQYLRLKRERERILREKGIAEELI
jgi:uncharacterized membrane protein YhiD involved in acid resistance